VFRAPFITPESLALGRANSLARENAYRLFAFCSAVWPTKMDFSFVEEEAREAFTLLALNTRRTGEIWGIREDEWIKVTCYGSKNPGVLVEQSLKSILGVGAHLSRFKCLVNFDVHASSISAILAGTPQRTIQVEPKQLIEKCLEVLAICTREAFELRTLESANNAIKGAI